MFIAFCYFLLLMTGKIKVYTLLLDIFLWESCFGALIREDLHEHIVVLSYRPLVHVFHCKNIYYDIHVYNDFLS